MSDLAADPKPRDPSGQGNRARSRSFIVRVLLVLGSYFAAQWLKVWRPRRRGQAGARIADRPPAAPVGAEPQTQAG